MSTLEALVFLSAVVALAVAATMPELSPEQVEAVEAWCAQLAA